MAPGRRIAGPAASDTLPQRQAAHHKRVSAATLAFGQFPERIVEDLNVWVDVYDADLNILLWNKVAEEISGYSRQEVIGRREIWEWSYPDETYRAAIIAKSASLLRDHQALEYFETLMRCKNGETKIMWWNSRRLVEAGGVVYGAITFGYDITDRKRAEEALLKAHNEILSLYVEHARLYQQAERLAVMEERQRLARDLHDSVTQSLYSLTLFAETGLRAAVAGDLEHVEAYFGRLAETAQDALKEMRLLVYELRPPALEREGLVGAIQRRLDAVERRAGVRARVLADATIELPRAVEEGLYRIAQEALNNALKHAEATTVTVRIGILDGRVELEVSDDGVGFDCDAIANGGGMGLVSMRERAEELGSALQIASAPGRGTTVSVSVEAYQE